MIFSSKNKIKVISQAPQGRTLQGKEGFTLVELLITITIFVIITGVVLINSNRFNSTILLNNFTYDVALTIKQAQSYGVNVRESSSGLFNSGYGVYFNIDMTSGSGGSRTNFVLYNDVTGPNYTGPADKTYNGSFATCPTNDIECIQRYSMQRGTYIKDICVGQSEASCSSVSKLSILFFRPNLNAIMYVNNGSTNNGNDYAKIILSAADNSTSSVIITSIGQVYVKK